MCLLHSIPNLLFATGSDMPIPSAVELMLDQTPIWFPILVSRLLMD